MKRLVAGIGICAALTVAVAAQMPKYGVKVSIDKKVDFAAFKTYSWTQGQPSANKAIDARVVAAVDRELSALGMSKAAAAPGDVLVTYYSLSRTDANVDAKPDAAGQLPMYPVGTLVVALLDPANRQRLVRLRIDKPIEIEPAKLDTAIDEAVSALFARYPTKGKSR